MSDIKSPWATDARFPEDLREHLSSEIESFMRRFK